MTEISQEDAINEFSQLMNPFLSSSANPRLLIETITDFYRDFRVANASIETDGDMLLLEWGTTNPNLISDFTDFRFLTDDDISFDTREFRWLGLTRQIFASENDEAEFDDEATALCAYLFFNEKSGDEPSANLWVSDPSELNNKLKEFLQNPFVKNLVDSEPSLVNAFVTHVG